MVTTSVFDFTDIGDYTITQATKKVLEVDEYKNVRISLTLKSSTGESYILDCVHALNVSNKVSKQKPIKFVVKVVDKWDESLGIHLEEDVISRKRCYLESEIDVYTLKDVDIFNTLFDNASTEVKRLY